MIVFNLRSYKNLPLNLETSFLYDTEQGTSMEVSWSFCFWLANTYASSFLDVQYTAKIINIDNNNLENILLQGILNGSFFLEVKKIKSKLNNLTRN